MIYFVIFYFIDIDVVTSNINYGNILWFWERCLHNSSKWGLLPFNSLYVWLAAGTVAAALIVCCERMGYCSDRLL